MASITLLLFASTLAACHGQSYITDSLTTQNNLRAKHHSPPLKLNSTLNRIAMQCAMYYAGIGKNDHSCPFINDSYGENLAWIGSTTGSPSQSQAAKVAVQNWYDENKNYNYDSPAESSGEILHFTQLVWKSSTQMGMASYQSLLSTKTYTCALYTPAGNVQVGGVDDEYVLFKENVLPP